MFIKATVMSEYGTMAFKRHRPMAAVLSYLDALANVLVRDASGEEPQTFGEVNMHLRTYC